MTAILGIFAGDGQPADDALVTRMMNRMGARGGARASLWRECGVVIAIARQEWEFGHDFSGPVLIVQDGDLVVAADASLYYRDDLRRKLADHGIRPKGQTPSHLILAAYKAFGERCAEALEGDFSFVIWDRKTRRLTAARDFMGRRGLFFSEFGSTLVIASAIGAILEHPLSSSDLNLASVAEAMAGYISRDASTCYKSVSRLHAGHTLTREWKGRPRISENWIAPTFHSGSALSFDDAADKLRELICDAVAERMSHGGATTVWMSGGRDSTAVFAAGMDISRRSSLNSDIRPVSISYPLGDSGREDETIAAVAARWNAEVRWVDIAGVPLLDLTNEHAARRDEPLAHVFEGAYRSLASATRALDSHIALDGVGGDQLFLRSNIQLADLFRTGRWVDLAHDWKAAGFAKSGFGAFFQWAVQPMLPTSMLLGAARLRRGRPLEAWLRRRLPRWINPDFAKQHTLPEYERVLSTRRRGEAIGSTESRWYFADAFFPYIYRLAADFALEQGVEIRSPLYDRRIIEFAATRPASDHPVGQEGKRLLRHAMRDLLPQEVLAAREGRSGTPQDYVGGALASALSTPFSELFPSSALETIGLVDIAALERSRLKFLRLGTPELRLPLLLTIHTELWLRGRGIGVSTYDRSDVYENELQLPARGAPSELTTPDSTEESTTPLFI